MIEGLAVLVHEMKGLVNETYHVGVCPIISSRIGQGDVTSILHNTNINSRLAVSGKY